MYLVIRKFNHVSSVAEAARRAESGIGQVLKQSPGFQGYYVFDAGDGVGGSVTLFESREAAVAANEKALAWIRPASSMSSMASRNHHGRGVLSQLGNRDEKAAGGS
jgi:hypothetical protein